MTTKFIEDHAVPQVGWRYGYRPNRKQNPPPFTVVEVIESERRCLTRRDDSTTRGAKVRSMRFDTLWYNCVRIDEKQDAPEPADLQKMVAMAVATAWGSLPRPKRAGLSRIGCTTSLWMVSCRAIRLRRTAVT